MHICYLVLYIARITMFIYLHVSHNHQVRLINVKDKRIIAVGAGRYHSAVCTAHEVFTFGKNLGQLGMYIYTYICRYKTVTWNVNIHNMDECIKHITGSCLQHVSACLV